MDRLLRLGDLPDRDVGDEPVSWRSNNAITPEQSASWYAARGAAGEQGEPTCEYCSGEGCADCLAEYDRDRLDDR